MSNFLQRLTARNRGVPVGTIRPASSGPTIWRDVAAEPETGRKAHRNGPTPKRSRTVETPQWQRRTPVETESQLERPAPSAPLTEITVIHRPPSASTVLPAPSANPPTDRKATAPAEAIASPNASAPPTSPIEVNPAATRPEKRANAAASSEKLPPHPTRLEPHREISATLQADPPRPTVEISIGRVEVGILPPLDASLPKPAPRRMATQPQLSLEGYLRRRDRQIKGGAP
jgi:hypothetical protein